MMNEKHENLFKHQNFISNQTLQIYPNQQSSLSIYQNKSNQNRPERHKKQNVKRR